MTDKNSSIFSRIKTWFRQKKCQHPRVGYWQTVDLGNRSVITRYQCKDCGDTRGPFKTAPKTEDMAMRLLNLHFSGKGQYLVEDYR